MRTPKLNPAEAKFFATLATAQSTTEPQTTPQKPTIRDIREECLHWSVGLTCHPCP